MLVKKFHIYTCGFKKTGCNQWGVPSGPARFSLQLKRSAVGKIISPVNVKNKRIVHGRLYSRHEFDLLSNVLLPLLCVTVVFLSNSAELLLSVFFGNLHEAFRIHIAGSCWWPVNVASSVATANQKASL